MTKQQYYSSAWTARKKNLGVEVRKKSWFIISVSLSICHALFFSFLTDLFKWCLTQDLNNLNRLTILIFFSLKAHMISTVVDGLYELEAWIVKRRSGILKNTYIIFRKKNKNLVQRLYGMTRFFFSFHLIDLYWLFVHHREIVPTVN
jgi:hypothetical protein